MQSSWTAALWRRYRRQSRLIDRKRYCITLIIWSLEYIICSCNASRCRLRNCVLLTMQPCTPHPHSQGTSPRFVHVANSPIGNCSQSRHSLSIGAVAGITAASLVTLFLLLGLLGLLWFRVRHQPGESKASPSAFGGTESTVGDPARMTTVVNPFVSSPSPPSSRTLPYNVSQFPHKGQVRFIAANEGSQTEVAPESVRNSYFVLNVLF